MARLVAVCREDEEDFKFLARQIPVFIDDSLELVMEFSDIVKDADNCKIKTSGWKQFYQHYSKLNQLDPNMTLNVTARDLCKALFHHVPCVGCRQSVGSLFSHMVESASIGLEPLMVKSDGALTIKNDCLANVKKLFFLFYVHGQILNATISSLNTSKKSQRCQLHCMDSHTATLTSGCWIDVWEMMSKECREEVVCVDTLDLFDTTVAYMRKHRFSSQCKNKVIKAYKILAGKLDSKKEKEYQPAIYEGLICVSDDNYIAVCPNTDFVTRLLTRAEPYVTGVYEKTHREVKTIDQAQEEVLTCVGIFIYRYLNNILQKVRAKEQTWQILFHLGIDALRRCFEMTVEKKLGFRLLEQFVENEAEKEKAKELRQEKKRQKRQNRRKNKGGVEMSDQVAEDKEEHAEECPVISTDSCRVCGNRSMKGTNGSPSCSCPDGTLKGLCRSNISDCGYSSSVEGSGIESREGSVIACTEEICNHNETAGDNHSHSAGDNVGDGTDSCVDCWLAFEARPVPKPKKRNRKKKNKDLSHKQGQNCASCVPDENRSDQSSHTRKTKDSSSVNSVASQPPSTCEKKPSHHMGPPGTYVSLFDMLEDSGNTSDEENSLTQEEIQEFVKRNQQFYKKRRQYREALKEKFLKYCNDMHRKL